MMLIVRGNTWAYRVARGNVWTFNVTIGEPVEVSNWILATGLWNDSNLWIDSETWNDG